MKKMIRKFVVFLLVVATMASSTVVLSAHPIALDYYAVAAELGVTVDEIDNLSENLSDALNVANELINELLSEVCVATGGYVHVAVPVSESFTLEKTARTYVRYITRDDFMPSSISNTIAFNPLNSLIPRSPVYCVNSFTPRIVSRAVEMQFRLNSGEIAFRVHAYASFLVNGITATPMTIQGAYSNLLGPINGIGWSTNIEASLGSAAAVTQSSISFTFTRTIVFVWDELRVAFIFTANSMGVVNHTMLG